PILDFGEDVAALFRKTGKMGRAGIRHHTDGLAALGEQNEKFASLEGRDTLVRLAVENQEWRGDLVSVHHGGKCQERRGIFFLQAHIVVRLTNITGGNEAEPIGDSRAFDGGFVAMGLRHGPRRHETAGTPTEDGLAIRVRPALSNGKIAGAVHIAVGAVSEMLINGLQEFGAVARRTAVLRLKNNIPVPGNEPGKKIELQRVISFRTSV